jgi:hydrogenase maturation protease
MDPGVVLSLVSTLDARPTRMLVVGCEPASIEEGMGLTPPVAAAVDEAVALVRRLVCA